MKKINILLVFLLLVTFVVSCNEITNDVKIDDVEVWSTYGTEKILQDHLDIYDDVKFGASIDAFCAKGEYEGTHIILTSKEKDINNINLEKAVLTNTANSLYTIDTDDIDIFFEKYIEVTKIYDKNGALTGWYPDAIVPIENICEVKENKMNAGTNQGLYIRFNVSLEQEPGIYTGTFKLKYAGYTRDIPVSLEVYDVEVSEETHSKNLFIQEWQYRLGELDSTQAMLEKYIEAGLEYRISPAGVVIDDSFDDAGIEYYVNTAAKFLQNPKCGSVSVPLLGATVDGVRAIDADTFEKVLKAFIAKSVEDNYDYLAKLNCHLVDEPQLNNAYNRTVKTCEVFYNTLDKMATYTSNLSITNEEFKEQLIKSVKNIRGIITASYETAYDGVIRTWCPTVDYYDTEANRAIYDAQEELYYEGAEEKWWYTCISPRAPFPTYHTEDTLLSARLMGWMQSEYDVVGNLFWATNVYAYYNGSSYENIEDFYTGNASRFYQVNGDGYLFYPGKVYGIDGPVGSLRLEAIRDGLEEYEILYSIKENYENVSDEISGTYGKDFSATTLIRNLATNLYTGTRVSTTGKDFDDARRSLYALAVMNQTNANFTVISCEDDQKGTITYTIYMDNSEFKLYSNNVEVSSSMSLENGKIYQVQIPLNKDKNIAKISIKSSTEEYTYEIDLGGKVLSYAPSTFATSFSKENANATGSIVAASTVDASLTGDLAKVVLGATTTKSQRFKFDPTFVKSIDSNTKKVIINIYSEYTSSLPLCIYINTTKSKYNLEIANVTLVKGMNNLEISLDSIDFVKQGSVNYMLILVGDTDTSTAEPERTLYFDSIVVYNK